MNCLAPKSVELRLLSQVEDRMLSLLPNVPSTVRDAGRYHLMAGGSRVRARLALQAAEALELDDNTSVSISSAVEILHNASLLHDDLQDVDITRRGQDAVWKKFGKNAAICTGDLLISAAYAALVGCNEDTLHSLITHMHQNTENVILGQQADLEAEHLTQDKYIAIAKMKSGPLLGLPVELCLIAAGQMEAVKNARQASYEIAVAYQVSDDIQDMDRDKKKGAMNFTSLSKGPRADLIEKAKLFASERALEAQRLAGLLPCGSGRGLILLAEHFINTKRII